MQLHEVHTSDGRFPYSKSKIKIFSKNRKKIEIYILWQAGASIFIDVEYIYIRSW